MRMFEPTPRRPLPWRSLLGGQGWFRAQVDSLSGAHQWTRYGCKCVTSVNIWPAGPGIFFTRRTHAGRIGGTRQGLGFISFNVRGSRPPSKYRASTRSNTEPGGETAANSVAHDLSFKSSGEPKM